MASTVEIIINAKDNASGVLRGVAGTIGNIAKVAGAAALAGGAALGAFLASSVKDAMEAENALAQLNAVIQSTGGAAGVTSNEIVAMADSLSQVTRFTDEAIMSGASMLLTFTNIGENVFPQATETILDMSQALGQDLQSSAIQLGKALNDPVEGITALRRVGVRFTDEQEKMIKGLVQAGKLEEAQTLILKELQIEFGGSAKAAGQTFAGQLDILKNKLSNVKEGIGQALIPALSKLGDLFAGIMANPAVLQFIDDFSSGIATLADRLLTLFTSGKAFDLSFITAMFSNWASSIDWAGLSTNLANGIKSIDWAAVGLEIRTAFLNIMNGLSTIVAEVDWAALLSAIGTALAGVLAGLYGYANFNQLATDFNNGFVYIGRVISDTIATWKLAIQAKLDEIRSTMLYKALEWVVAIVTGIQHAPALVIGILSVLAFGAAQKLGEFVRNGGDMAKDWGGAVLDGLQKAADKIMDFIGDVISMIEDMFASINIKIPLPNLPGAPGGGGTGGSTGGGSGSANSGPASGGGGAGVPMFASGGLAKGPASGHLAMLHGTEGIFTREQMAMLAPVGSGAGGVTINLTYAPAVSLASEAELEQHLLPVILKGARQALRQR